MQDILFNSYFKNIAVPIFTVLLTICVKSVSKPDVKKLIRSEDLAIGLDLCVTSLAIFATSMVDLLGKYATSESTKNLRKTILPGSKLKVNIQDLSKHLLEFDELQKKLYVSWWIGIGLCIVTFLVAFLVGKYGWTRQSGINVFTGVFIPNIIGMISLISVVAWIGN